MPKLRRTTLLIALTTALVALTASPAAAAPVFSNGFEDPPFSVGYQQYVAGQQFGGWTVASGSVDVVTYWENAEGRQSLDLNGNAEGAVARTLPAQLLTTYKVSFAVAGNPEGGPTIKSGKVTVNGQQVDSFTFSVAGKNIYNMGWVTAASTSPTCCRVPRCCSSAAPRRPSGARCSMTSRWRAVS